MEKKKNSILNRQELWIKIFLHVSLNSETTVFGDGLLPISCVSL